MRPLDGSISRLIIFSAVVLPQPDGPTSTVSSPAANVRSSSATATVPSAYTLLTPSRRISSALPAAWPTAAGVAVFRGGAVASTDALPGRRLVLSAVDPAGSVLAD